jgi:2-hydroxychromene-2-carboxylate isomerase
MNARVTVCIDFKNPLALLAIGATRELEARLGTLFDWRPVDVPGLPAPRPIVPGSDRGTQRGSHRAAYLERDTLRYARAQGLELGDLYRAPDTALASQGLLWLRREAPERSGEYVARIFELLWQRGADVARAEVVEAALGGEPHAFRDFAAKEGSARLAENQRELLDAGVWGVLPAYLLHGEVFLGRQHLPMVEWLCSGKTGAPPI